MPTKSGTMLDEITSADTKADDGDLHADLVRYRRLALAALKPLAKPIEAMIDAAPDAVQFDNIWATNTRRDFRKAVRAVILAAMKEDGASR